jgi:ribosomal protein S18 acetylase RimI-like enzyme
MNIRPVTPDDHDGIWAVLEPVIRAGDTLTQPRDSTREAALAYWLAPDHDVFVAEEDGAILGSYFVRRNYPGAGAHVANAGYVTSPAVRGRGIARAMCAHSLDHARSRGFRAMQYNIVISTNERAVRLWQAMGFAIVGQLPGVFAHPQLGDVDAFVMHRTL